MVVSFRSRLIFARALLVGFALLAGGTPLAAQQPPPAEALILRELLFARGIAENEPQGATDEFRAEQDVAFAFGRFDNNGGQQPVTFVWYHEGTEIRRSTRQIGRSRGWRTYDSVRLRPGKWKVELLAGDPPGPAFAEREFTVR